MSASAGRPRRPLLERYGRYLTGQRSLSDNTRRIYLDDLHTFLSYCRRKGMGLSDMDRQMLRGYVAYLATEGRTDGERPKGYARVSIVRKLTALRTFLQLPGSGGLVQVHSGTVREVLSGKGREASAELPGQEGGDAIA